MNLKGIREFLAGAIPLPNDAVCPGCRKFIRSHPAVQERGIMASSGLLCRCQELGQERARLRGAYAQLPLGRTFENFTVRPKHSSVQKAAVAVKRWAQGEGPPLVMMYGDVGSGKSHLAAAAGHAILERGEWVAYREEARWFSDLYIVQQEQSWGEVQLVIDDLCTVRWLIYDDLGTVTQRDFVVETVMKLVQARWSERLPSLFTTNIKADRLPKRVADRLQDKEVAETIAIDAPSWRTA